MSQNRLPTFAPQGHDDIFWNDTATQRTAGEAMMLLNSRSLLHGWLQTSRSHPPQNQARVTIIAAVAADSIRTLVDLMEQI
jgi:hypothetical protein